MRGISFWLVIGILGFSASSVAGPEHYGLFIFVVSYGLFWFVLHSWMMHYFRVSQNFLVVRNHLAFWKNKAYRFKEIKEIVFETRDKMPNCLRVITKDFRSKLYPAGTLRDKTWLLMKDKFESHGITVRNECI